MKNKILIIAILFLSKSILAQKAPVKVTWGAYDKKSRSSTVIDLIGNDKVGYYVIRTKGNMLGGGIFGGGNNIIIDKLNDKMNVVKSEKVNMDYKGKRRAYEGFYLLKNNLVLLSSYKNNKKDKEFIFAESINLKTLKPKGDLKIVMEMESEYRFRQGDFNIRFSRDSSKMLVFGNISNKGRENESFQIKVMDNSLKELWENVIELPYDENTFGVNNFNVNNNGDVLVLGKIYPRGVRKTRNDRSNYFYTLLSYKKGENNAKEYKLDLGDKFITDLTVESNNRDKIICAGFYSDRAGFRQRGTYYIQIDANSGEIISQNLKEFDFEFLTELMTEKQKRKAAKNEAKGKENRQAELYSYDLDDLILRSDGGALLLAEQYYVTTSTTTQRSPTGFWETRTNFHYHYNGIIAVNINPKGTIDWASHIPKYQRSTNDGGFYSSYSHHIGKDAIYVIFNDNVKNLERRKSKDKRLTSAFRKYKDSIAVLAKISLNGKVSFYPLFGNKELKTMVRPKIGTQIGKNTSIIYGVKGKKYRFARLDF